MIDDSDEKKNIHARNDDYAVTTYKCLHIVFSQYKILYYTVLSVTYGSTFSTN